ncbi:TIGR00645 family protein [Rhodoblastus sp. 17X3]|uniref:TIGR00645 family protein n=1 Tax=Rhodoblastus sp. 17X3 TaxID=3047026 RepID=UPI0024B85327|nr:TIGR00645 family protein [Rhodoblastus sp. 17X3]MDI9849327.1 TIGR00645 family protein [Rhodoblastus sp. 17X3]
MNGGNVRFGKRVELLIQNILFASRWLLAPFYVALALAMVILLIKAGQHSLHLLHDSFGSEESTVVLDTLGLIDLTLTSSLVVLVILSGFENFVAKVEPDGASSRPTWLTQIDFGGLKLKLMSSIVAISAIQTLRVFMDLERTSDRDLAWNVGIHLSFVLSAVLLALSDRISHGSANHGSEAQSAANPDATPAKDGGH